MTLAGRIVGMPAAARLFFPWLLLVILTGCKSGAAPETVWLGHVAPLSGPDKVSGDHAHQGILLATEEVNQAEANHVAGRVIRVVQVDPGNKPITLDAEAVRLITVNRVVALLGGAELAEAEPLGRAAHPYGVPVVTPAALPPQLAVDTLYSVNAGLAFEGQALARFAAEELKAKRAALLVDCRQAASGVVATALTTEFAKTTVVLQEWSYKDDKELAGLAIRVKQAQADVVVYAGMVGDLATLRDRLRSEAVAIPLLLAADSFHAAAAPAEAVKGLYFATPFVAEREGPAAEFVKKYQERFRQPPDVHAALAYDGLRVLLEGLRRAKEPKAELLRNELAQEVQPTSGSPFDSVSGPLYFDGSHNAQRPLLVAQWNEGQIKKIKQYDPPR
jgi:branched-chain amino acid transport system substrate-binding protein